MALCHMNNAAGKIPELKSSHNFPEVPSIHIIGGGGENHKQH